MKTLNVHSVRCPLRTHYLNTLDDVKPVYKVQFNGEDTGLTLPLKQAICSDEWDIITFEQVNQKAPHYESYQPYLTELTAFMRRYFPHSKIMLHQTWAYEEGSPRMQELAGYDSSAAMLADIRTACEKAAADIGADGIIPAGEALIRCLENGIAKVHAADTYHANPLGQYAAALTWYGYLTGKSVTDVPFCDLGDRGSEEEIALAKRSAAEVLGQV